MTDAIIQALDPGWAQNSLYRFLQILSEEELFYQPSLTVSPIAWHIWHVARCADMLQASFRGQQVWERDQLVTMYELDAAKLGLLQMGALQDSQDAAIAPKQIGKNNLLSYSREVFDCVGEVFASLTRDDLYEPRESILKINWDARPQVEGKGRDVLTVNDLTFHHGHSQRHLGMVEALVGVLFERQGTATI